VPTSRADESAPHRTARTAVVWDVLRPVVDAAAGPLDVLDVGGGTGGFAVPLAALGHRVTVVDPSPDALASLQRRARDAGVEVHALQGDAAGLLDVVGAGGAVGHERGEVVEVALHAGDPVADAALGGPALQGGEGVRAGVDDGDPVAGRGERDGEAAGAAAGVDDRQRVALLVQDGGEHLPHDGRAG